LLSAKTMKDAEQAPSVCILDLDLQFGAIADHLDLKSYTPVSELEGRADRLDPEMFSGMTVRAKSGINVFTAPRYPLPYNALDDRTVERLLAVARYRNQFVIVDLPQSLTDWTDAVLRRSDYIFFVIQLNVSAIRHARRLLDMLVQEGLHDLPIKLVVNRYSGMGSFGGNVGIGQIEKALGRKIDYYVPNDFDLLSKSVNEGRPAASVKPNSKYVNAISEILAKACGIQPRQEKSFLGAWRKR